MQSLKGDEALSKKPCLLEMIELAYISRCIFLEGERVVFGGGHGDIFEKCAVGAVIPEPA